MYISGQGDDGQPDREVLDHGGQGGAGHEGPNHESGWLVCGWVGSWDPSFALHLTHNPFELLFFSIATVFWDGVPACEGQNSDIH